MSTGFHSANRRWRRVAGLLVLLAGVAAVLRGFDTARLEQPTAAGTLPAQARVVAHAGGGFKGGTYLNCREALDYNYRLGYRLFELDFSWTTDGDLVLIHDWNKTLQRLFIGETGRLSRPAFVAARMVGGLTQMTLDDLLLWLSVHPGAHVITDVKERNVHGLALIRERAGSLRGRFIPQFYNPANAAVIRGLGYEHMIFTNYRANLSQIQLLQLMRQVPLYAVTVPHRLARTPGFSSALAAEGMPVYAHTINTEREFAELLELGNFGVYSDWLSPRASRMKK